MALTGYTRNGHCVDRYDDSGSHHVCIDLSSLGGDGSHKNFCEATGQPDWCSSQNMPCHEDPRNSNCPIQNWCVCEWAFASYIERAGGCDKIQSIVCESTNVQTLKAYQELAAKQPKYREALNCLVK